MEASSANSARSESRWRGNQYNCFDVQLENQPSIRHSYRRFILDKIPLFIETSSSAIHHLAGLPIRETNLLTLPPWPIDVVIGADGPLIDCGQRLTQQVQIAADASATSTFQATSISRRNYTGRYRERFGRRRPSSSSSPPPPPPATPHSHPKAAEAMVQRNHVIAIIILVLFVILAGVSFGIWKVVQIARKDFSVESGGTSSTGTSDLVDDD
ncbi:hypothetical protein RJ55_00886 [Drechmeria coniospora]|nr:hypothetical protein RJ55_00886 [Drechmeria coniospora]